MKKSRNSFPSFMVINLLSVCFFLLASTEANAQSRERSHYRVRTTRTTGNRNVSRKTNNQRNSRISKKQQSVSNSQLINGISDNTQSNRTITVNGISFIMVYVPGGTFQMGSNDGITDEKTISRYRRMVKEDEEVGKIWKNLNSACQKRADIIPNIVNVIKGYATHEKATIELVNEARTKATQLLQIINVEDFTEENMEQYNAALSELSSALNRLWYVSDSYTDLKADEHFKELKLKLEETEIEINKARDKFYEALKSYDSKDGVSDEKPIHSVTLSSFYIGQTEVTQGLWEEVMGDNPSFTKYGYNWPVEQVSWDDCQIFIRKLNNLTGLSFRLPTEAEWEFAARGGNNSRGYKYSGSNVLGKVASYIPDHDRRVARRMPNELGIYDMSGNVYEWCQDWYDTYRSSAQLNPVGPASGSFRVNRGGSFISSEKNCRVSYRCSNTTGYRFFNLGLRLAL
jgi:formylglycine-generating enzyme required for sulfatase activity